MPAQGIATQVRFLLEQAHADPLPAVDDDLQLRAAGLSLSETMMFLVLIEDHFGISLDENMPEDALRSVNSMAHFLAGIGVG
jgi:hypothetical protein